MKAKLTIMTMRRRGKKEAQNQIGNPTRKAKKKRRKAMRKRWLSTRRSGKALKKEAKANSDWLNRSFPLLHTSPPLAVPALAASYTSTMK